MKPTKDQQLALAAQLLSDSEKENSNLRYQLEHIGDFARGVNSDSLDMAPAEFGTSLWTEEVDTVADTVRMLMQEISLLKVDKFASRAKVDELRADIDQKKAVLGLQAKAIEDSELKRTLLAKACQRRHEAIEAVLTFVGHDFDPENTGDTLDLTDGEEILYRQILKTANTD